MEILSNIHSFIAKLSTSDTFSWVKRYGNTDCWEFNIDQNSSYSCNKKTSLVSFSSDLEYTRPHVVPPLTFILLYFQVPNN